MMESLTGHAGETHVRLLVKAPDQQIDDQTVECTLDWTVARLKDHLAQVYPSKPKREEQKIIFSGHLLNDTMILKDVLQQYYNREDSLFIVHLVCGRQSKMSPPNERLGTSIGITGQPATSVSATSATVEPNPVQQYYSQLNNQQMAWMQQAYAHYLTRYMQIMAAQGIELQSTPLYSQPLNINASAGEMMNNNNNNNATTNNNNTNLEDNEDNEGMIMGVGATRGAALGRVEGPPAGQQIVGDGVNVANNNNNNNNNLNNNNNNNNVPAEEVGGAAVNRDWLDVFDMLSRIVVLSSIVYFYSSPSRFLIVTFLGFAIYLIQGGFFRGQPAFLAENNNARAADNNNQVGQNEVGQPPAAPLPQQVPRIPTEIQVPEEHVEATRTNLNEENERPGAWAFTWTFFSSFFASLIPDQPNVI